MKKMTFVLLLLSALLWLAGLCAAQDGARLTPTGELETKEGAGDEGVKDRSLALTLEGIVRYDTNPEVVSDNEEEDWSEVLKLDVERKFYETGGHEFGGRYAFYGEFYRDLIDRDLVGHVFSLYHSVDLNPLLIRTDYLFSHYLLGQKTYLRKHTLAPMMFYVSGERTLEMVRLTFSANDYPETETLEGTDFSAQIRHFYFLDAAKKKRLSIGYKYRNVDADADSMDYTAHQFRGDVKAPLVYGITGQARLDYIRKDYDEGRNDDMIVYALEFSKPLNRLWTLILAHEGSENDSDDPNSEYSRRITSLSIKTVF